MGGEADRRRAEAMGVIGSELRRLRESHGLTQQALADRVSVSRSHLCQVELGRTWASADFLVRCESVLGEPGRLVALLRTAKVPASAPTEATTHLDVVAHKFIPMRTPLDVSFDTAVQSINLEGIGITSYLLGDTKGTSDAHVFPFGVTVLHHQEQQRFSNVAHLAHWRQGSHGTALAWASDLLERHTNPRTTATPSHVLSVFEVVASPWSRPDDLQTGMRLLSVPSTLIDRRAERGFATISRAEEAEQDLMRHGFEHPEIVDFGVKGVSTACASWSGVSYIAHAPTRALPFGDLVAWELLIQALWCYCDHTVSEVHNDRTPDIHPDFGERFLGRMAKRLALAGAQEHLQRRLMKDAILTTSRLPLLLDQAQQALQDCSSNRTVGA